MDDSHSEIITVSVAIFIMTFNGMALLSGRFLCLQDHWDGRDGNFLRPMETPRELLARILVQS